MNNQLAKTFDFAELMRFSVPTMVMMVFMSLYQTIDGIFISNLVGELGLTALNVVYPFTSVVIAVAVMLASGGGAVIALNMGQGRSREAKENFTLIVFFGILLSLLITLLGSVFLEQLIHFLGSTPRIDQLCRDYLWIMVLSAPLAVLQLLFQTFFVTAGKPRLGLLLTGLSGVANIVLDALFMGYWHMGVRGAAYATAVGYGISALYGLYYFSTHRHGQLYFIRPKLRWGVLKKSCLNGSSEMVNNMAVAVTTLLFNIVGLCYLQEEGVAAISIILYAQYVMTSVFMGYSTGVAPIFSYKYGAGDTAQIHRLFRLSMRFVTVLSLLVFLISFPLARPIALIFASHHPYVLSLAVYGFKLFAISFLFTGLNIFTSSLFTAFSNGLISGLLSLFRTFLLLTIALIVLPMKIGADGIWLAVPLAEGIAILFSLLALFCYRKVYSFSLH